MKQLHGQILLKKWSPASFNLFIRLLKPRPKTIKHYEPPRTTIPRRRTKAKHPRKNSTISAGIIALFCCALILAILFYIALSPLSKNTEEMDTCSSGSEKDEPVTKQEMTNEVEKTPSPSSSTAKVIAANTTSLRQLYLSLM